MTVWLTSWRQPTLKYKIEVVWFYTISDVLDNISEKKGDSKSMKAKKKELRDKMWAHVLLSTTLYSKMDLPATQATTILTNLSYHLTSKLLTLHASSVSSHFMRCPSTCSVLISNWFSRGDRCPLFQAGMSTTTCAWGLLFLSVYHTHPGVWLSDLLYFTVPLTM